jgi:hypothetical protein
VKDEIEFWRYGEWTMVYLNGRLERAGDHYLADEWLQGHFGVDVIDDEAGDSIVNGRDAVRTLDEVHERQLHRMHAAERAEEKRIEARQLLAEADEIEVK